MLCVLPTATKAEQNPHNLLQTYIDSTFYFTNLLTFYHVSYSALGHPALHPALQKASSDAGDDRGRGGGASTGVIDHRGRGGPTKVAVSS